MSSKVPIITRPPGTTETTKDGLAKGSWHLPCYCSSYTIKTLLTYILYMYIYICNTYIYRYLYTDMYLYIYIYIYMIFILSQGFWIPYRKLARVGFEPTTLYLPWRRSNHWAIWPNDDMCLMVYIIKRPWSSSHC